MILNLKHFNKFVDKHKFKMETLNSILDLMSEGCFMTSIDLKDAYLVVAIALQLTMFLKFHWQGVMYKLSSWPSDSHQPHGSLLN